MKQGRPVVAGCTQYSDGTDRKGIVNLTRSSQPSRTLFLERGQPCRRAKDFSAPNRRATDGRRIAPLLKLTMPSGALITKPTTVHEAGAGSTFRRALVPKDWCLVRGRYGHAADGQAKPASGTLSTLGGSNERLDCDRLRRRHYCRIGDYGCQRGPLRAGKYARLLQYSREDRLQLGP